MPGETPEFAPADPMPPEIVALRDSTAPVWIFAYRRNLAPIKNAFRAQRPGAGVSRATYRSRTAWRA